MKKNRLKALFLSLIMLLSPSFALASDSSKYSNQDIKIVILDDSIDTFKISALANNIRVVYSSDGETSLTYDQTAFNLITNMDSMELDPITDTSIVYESDGNTISNYVSVGGISIINGTTIKEGRMKSEPIELAISTIEPVDITLETLSGNIKVTDIPNIGNLSTSTLSGDILIDNIQSLDILVADTLSGNIYLRDNEPVIEFVKTLSGLIKRK